MQAIKNNKILIILFVLVIIAAVLFWPKNKAKDVPVYGTPENNPPQTPGVKPAVIKPKPTREIKPPVLKAVQGGIFPIKEGSRGTKVKTLQTALNKALTRFNMGNKLKVDGVYGGKTIAAAIKFNTGAAELSENDYNLLLYRLETGPKPAVPGKNWPLKMGDTDTGNDTRIKRLRLAMGLPANSEFTQRLQDELSLKLLTNTVSESQFKTIMGASLHPDLLGII